MAKPTVDILRLIQAHDAYLQHNLEVRFAPLVFFHANSLHELGRLRTANHQSIKNLTIPPLDDSQIPLLTSNSHKEWDLYVIPLYGNSASSILLFSVSANGPGVVSDTSNNKAGEDIRLIHLHTDFRSKTLAEESAKKLSRLGILGLEDLNTTVHHLDISDVSEFDNKLLFENDLFMQTAVMLCLSRFLLYRSYSGGAGANRSSYVVKGYPETGQIKNYMKDPVRLAEIIDTASTLRMYYQQASGQSLLDRKLHEFITTGFIEKKRSNDSITPLSPFFTSSACANLLSGGITSAEILTHYVHSLRWTPVSDERATRFVACNDVGEIKRTFETMDSGRGFPLSANVVLAMRSRFNISWCVACSSPLGWRIYVPYFSRSNIVTTTPDNSSSSFDENLEASKKDNYSSYAIHQRQLVIMIESEFKARFPETSVEISCVELAPFLPRNKKDSYAWRKLSVAMVLEVYRSALSNGKPPPVSRLSSLLADPRDRRSCVVYSNNVIKEIVHSYAREWYAVLTKSVYVYVPESTAVNAEIEGLVSQGTLLARSVKQQNSQVQKLSQLTLISPADAPKKTDLETFSMSLTKNGPINPAKLAGAVKLPYFSWMNEHSVDKRAAVAAVASRIGFDVNAMKSDRKTAKRIQASDPRAFSIKAKWNRNSESKKGKVCFAVRLYEVLKRDGITEIITSQADSSRSSHPIHLVESAWVSRLVRSTPFEQNVIKTNLDSPSEPYIRVSLPLRNPKNKHGKPYKHRQKQHQRLNTGIPIGLFVRTGKGTKYSDLQIFDKIAPTDLEENPANQSFSELLRNWEQAYYDTSPSLWETKAVQLIEEAITATKTNQHTSAVSNALFEQLPVIFDRDELLTSSNIRPMQFQTKGRKSSSSDSKQSVVEEELVQATAKALLESISLSGSNVHQNETNNDAVIVVGDTAKQVWKRQQSQKVMLYPISLRSVQKDGSLSIGLICDSGFLSRVISMTRSPSPEAISLYPALYRITTVRNDIGYEDMVLSGSKNSVSKKAYSLLRRLYAPGSLALYDICKYDTRSAAMEITDPSLEWNENWLLLKTYLGTIEKVYVQNNGAQSNHINAKMDSKFASIFGSYKPGNTEILSLLEESFILAIRLGL